MMGFTYLRIAAGILASLLSFGCSGRTDAQANALPSAEFNAKPSPEDCAAAARAELGAASVVLRSGTLSDTAVPEVLAALKLKSAPTRPGCTPVTRLALLRKAAGRWTVALDASKEIRNPFGYVGMDFIDDSYQFFGYCVDIENHRSDNTRAFTLFLTYLKNREGDTEGAPVEISWNPKLARYQEFAEGFKYEIANPPHRGSSKRECRRK